MWEQTLFFLNAMYDQTGAAHFWWGNLVMIVIGATMIYLAIAKHYEPLLLVGIGFSCIIANVPGLRPDPAGRPVPLRLPGRGAAHHPAADLSRRRRDDRFRRR